MRKIIYLLALTIGWAYNSNAQTKNSEVKSGYVIVIHTMNNNFIKGILIDATDSAVTIFPGSVHQWKQGKDFRIAVFSYENIKQIKLKKRKAALKGMRIGGSIGLTTGIASSID